VYQITKDKEMQMTCATNVKLLLTITSEESLTSLDSVLVTLSVFGFSDSQIVPLGSLRQRTRSRLLRHVASFLRPFLKVGDDWARELLDTTAAGRLDVADVILVGWTEALCPMEDSWFETLLSDVICFSDKIGGILKRKYERSINRAWNIIHK